MVISVVILQSQSSEILPADLPRKIANRLRSSKAYERKKCAAFETFGIKACADIESHNAAFIRDCPLYAIIGRHAVLVEIAPGK